MDYLLFQLYGPLAAWGSSTSLAVGQERASDAHPSQSALLGLLAAALGVPRQADEAHQRMAAAYGFAVRIDSPGVLLRDYHTSQVPPERRNVVYRTRRDELLAESLNTILSSREYRCDAFYTVAVWVKSETESAPYTLEALASSLRAPRFTLYLGRKSCPLALPLQPRVKSAATLARAFEQIPCEDPAGLGLTRLTSQERPLICWDGDGDVELGELCPLQTVVRRDQPLSRRRWQFDNRRERQGRIDATESG